MIGRFKSAIQKLVGRILPSRGRVAPFGIRPSRAKFKLEGVGQVRANMRKFRGFGPRSPYGKGYERGFRRALRFLLNESKKIVPLDKGDLRKGAYVEFTGKGLEIDGEVGYNRDGKQPYAIIQHENLDYKHKEGRSAKYLELPFRLYRSIMLAMIGEETKKL